MSLLSQWDLLTDIGGVETVWQPSALFKRVMGVIYYLLGKPDLPTSPPRPHLPSALCLPDLLLSTFHTFRLIHTAAFEVGTAVLSILHTRK